MRLFGLKISKGARAPKFKVKIGFLIFWFTLKRFHSIQECVVYRDELRKRFFLDHIDKTLDV